MERCALKRLDAADLWAKLVGMNTTESPCARPLAADPDPSFIPPAGLWRADAPAPAQLARALKQAGQGPVCGVDEAGRGPWAGPVVAAAVRLDPADVPDGLDDSKKLSEARREQLFAELEASAQIGVGIADVDEIDRDNILQATFTAMARAVAALPKAPVLALIDGNRVPPVTCPSLALVKGDSLVPAIAAASIVAKVTRDRMMRALDEAYPGYGFAGHKGYGTRAHAEALDALGVSAAHRRSFAPIRARLGTAPRAVA